MTAVVLAPGDLGADMAGFRLDTAAKLAQFREAGGKFVFRYSAGAATLTSNPSHSKNAYKLITPAEHAALLAAGIDIIANDEWYAGRMKEGATAGTQDGAAAFALWKACGHAKGSRIYCSLDQSGTASDVPNIGAYLRAFQAACGNGYYLADFYGGTPVIRALVSAHLAIDGWRPNAGSWSGDGLPYQPSNPKALLAEAQHATPAHIWQTGNYWFGKDADEDMILRVPVGSHFEALAVTPPPVPPKPPTTKPGPYHGKAWPGWMKAGNYFGLITGPAVSHGGIDATEKADIVCIQRMLILLGYVPGIHDFYDKWANGIFGPPTAAAVTAFQHAHMPGTKFYGQVWSDDWHTLMNLSVPA